MSVTRLKTVKIKKAKFGTCYHASHMRQTQNQKCFTILEVAADWHELIIAQRTMRPSTARVNEQLDPRFAASRHTIAPITHTMPSPRSL